MENPVKEPILDWLQLNLADKALRWDLQYKARRDLRCGKYVDFSIHPVSTNWSTTFCLGMAGSSAAPTPDPQISTATVTTTTTISLKERTCDLGCIEINYLWHTFAEVDDDDDFDMEGQGDGFDMEGLGDDSHFCELFPKARPGTNTVRFIEYETD